MPVCLLLVKQLISLVVFLFSKIQEEAIACSCLLLATPPGVKAMTYGILSV